MFTLTISFGPGPMVWTLMFKTEENLRESYSKWTSETIMLKDDFGQECHLNPEECHGWMIEDLEQSKLAHIERALHQARTQAKGAELAEADVTLRAARARAQGQMPILQPMPGGFGNGRFPS